MKLPLQRHPKEAYSTMTRAVLWQNEIEANRLTTVFMCICSAVMALSMLLTAVGIFTENAQTVYTTGIATIVWHMLPCLVSFRYKYAKPWLKNLLLAGLILGQARLDCGLGFNTALSILIPVVFSTRYYSRKFTLSVAAITTMVFSVTTYLGAATGFTPVDKNILLEASRYAHDVMMTSFLPKWFLFAVISAVCVEVAHWGRAMVEKQAVISQEHSRVETELHTATQIQLKSLPDVKTLCEGHEAPFELATSILPAKEVGGDFYDFFYVDPTHLALVIADVSGKGVPAALFMMVSKILLDNSASAGRTPGKVLTMVNHQLCEKNIIDMFVTVWLGIIDLTTGEMVSANAGHENPIICRKDGTVEVIRTKHGMVLGGMEGMRYRDETLQLHPGDTLFVYTDGIPEAHNSAAQMYGMERLVSVLTGKTQMNAQALVDLVKQDVNAFAG